MQKNKILWGSDNNAVIALLAINLVIFAFFRIMYIIFQNDTEMHLIDYNNLVQQFKLPSSFSAFLEKPWTLVSYFFSNDKYLMLLTNMLWLFTFSYLLQIIVGNQYIVPSYIYGGLIGGIVYLSITTFLPISSQGFIGATPAIFSLAGSLIGFAPKHKLLNNLKFGFPVWILVLLFVIVDGISNFGDNKYILIAHYAALAIGFIYAKSVQKGNDFGNWMHQLYDYVLGKKPTNPTSPKVNNYYQQKVAPYNKMLKVNEITVNEVLDKINKSGISSLSEAENLILQKAKNKL